MDQKIWQDAYRRVAQDAPARVDRRMRDILYDDVPTFMELPHARQAAAPSRARSAFGGVGFERELGADAPLERALPLGREAYEPRLKMGHFHLTLTGTLYPTADIDVGVWYCSTVRMC